MRNVAKTIWVAVISVAASIAAFDGVSAQVDTAFGGVSAQVGTAFGGAGVQTDAAGGCALCVSCDDCENADWGALFCDFGGSDPNDPEGSCCRHRGGICNPTLSMNIDDDNRRFVLAGGDGEGVLVARLDGAVFGTWACEDGVLREAYRELDDGTFDRLDGPELRAYRLRYPLDRYIGLLNDRLHEAAMAVEAG